MVQSTNLAKTYGEPPAFPPSFITVEYIDHMGSDTRVVDAARVSFNKRCTNPGLQVKDRNLIKYLADHGHFTPFTHPQITLVYKVPIFVARQEFKHIVGFTRNEVSRRYVDDAPETFRPEIWRGRPEANIKQGSGGALKDQESPNRYFDFAIKSAFNTYTQMIDAGVAPEQARMVLPQSSFTEYFVTGSLYAFSRMYRLRVDPHAQAEIQLLAEMVGGQIAKLFPVSWGALTGASK